MRKEYDFSRRRPFHEARDPGGSSGAPDLSPLTPGQVREIRRRIADSDDPTRYLIVSGFGRRFQLYYNVEDDVYVMNEPRRGMLFKRRQLAAAAKLLGRHIKVLKCTARRHRGERVLVLKSVPVAGHRFRSSLISNLKCNTELLSRTEARVVA